MSRILAGLLFFLLSFLAWVHAISGGASSLREADRLAREQDYEGTIARLDAAIRRDARAPEPRRLRAFAYSHLRRHQDAVTDLTIAVALDPEDAWSYWARGENYEHLGRYDLALSDYAKAALLQADDVHALAGLQRLLAPAHGTDSGLVELEELMAEAGMALTATAAPNALHLRVLAWVENVNGHYAEAERLVRAALAMAPDAHLGQRELGIALLELGRPAEALPVLETAARLQPDDQITAYALKEAQEVQAAQFPEDPAGSDVVASGGLLPPL